MRMKTGDNKGEMNETGSENSEVNLIDDTHVEQILTNTIAQTFPTAKGDKRTQVVQQTEKEHNQWTDDEKTKGDNIRD